MMDMAVKMANDADMQGGMASVLEMLSDKASMLSTASTSESQQMIANAAKEMKMSEMAITNICAATASAMLTSNMTAGSELDAMVNCATSKDETFIPMEQINKLSAGEVMGASDASTSSNPDSAASSSSSVSQTVPTLTSDDAMSSTQPALTSIESALTTASASTAQQMTTGATVPRYTTVNVAPPSKLQASGTNAMVASVLLSAIISALAI
ncbi:hypothetical protein BJ741DRAFT_593899 [Chytriomyces cf. hyalinus JEL632]|nr:hypothetical protein BJ741DRAFT_593899 [Chytriomyces cf. hyalinus JEL632]